MLKFWRTTLNLETIKSEWTNDSKINSNDIQLESIKTSSLHSKYINELADHKGRLVKLTALYDTEKKFKIRYYSGLLTKEELESRSLDQYNGKKLLKTDMMDYLAGDLDIQKIKLKIEHEGICIYTLTEIIKAIHGRGYDIKSHIEYLKFSAGF